MTKTAAILVGGHARRLGGLDKSRLEVGGRSILARQVEVLNAVADHVFLVGGTGAVPAWPGLVTIPDLRPACGSLGGIYTALAAGAGPVLVLACDLPFVTPAFLTFLWDALGHADAVLPRTTDGLHPLCAVYAPSCIGPMGRRLDAGLLKVADALLGLNVREIGPQELAPFDPDGCLLMNLNTPEDVSRAVARAGTPGA